MENMFELTDITPAQRNIAQRMQAESFSFNEGDIDCITDLELNINLSNHQSVQKNHTSIHRALYQEVKHHIEGVSSGMLFSKSFQLSTLLKYMQFLSSRVLFSKSLIKRFVKSSFFAVHFRVMERGSQPIRNFTANTLSF